jgi:hypothetical protein
MAMMALVVAIVSAVAAVAAICTRRLDGLAKKTADAAVKSAAAAETAVTLDKQRRHDELAPRFRVGASARSLIRIPRSSWCPAWMSC